MNDTSDNRVDIKWGNHVLLYDCPWNLDSNNLQEIWNEKSVRFLVNKMLSNDETERQRAFWICHLLVGAVGGRQTHELFILSNLIRALIYGLADADLQIRLLSLKSIASITEYHSEVCYSFMVKEWYLDIIDTVYGFIFNEDWDGSGVGLICLGNVITANCDHKCKADVISKSSQICSAILNVICDDYQFNPLLSDFDKWAMIDILENVAKFVTKVILNADRLNPDDLLTVQQYLQLMARLLYVHNKQIWKHIVIAFGTRLDWLPMKYIRHRLIDIFFVLKTANNIYVKIEVFNTIIKFCESTQKKFDINDVINGVIASWISDIDLIKYCKKSKKSDEDKLLFMKSLMKCVTTMIKRGIILTDRMMMFYLEVLDFKNDDLTKAAIDGMKCYWHNCGEYKQQRLLQKGIFNTLSDKVTQKNSVFMDDILQLLLFGDELE